MLCVMIQPCTPTFNAGYNAFDCKKHAPWPVDYDDDGAATMSIQNYINAYQYNCGDGREVKYVTISNCGIGAALSFSVIDFMKTFKDNKIYRPLNNWKWTSNATTCSLQGGQSSGKEKEKYANEYQSQMSKISEFPCSPPNERYKRLSQVWNHIDCYSVPLSTCPDLHSTSNFSDFRRDMDAAKAYLPYPTDVCTMGTKTKKSMLWLVGNFFQYHMRLDPILIPKYASAIENIFPDSLHMENKNYFIQGHPLDHVKQARRLREEKKQIKTKHEQKKLHDSNGNDNQSVNDREASIADNLTCVSAALHVRGGRPDGSRKPFHGKEHIAMLDGYGDELARENKKICDVFVGSDHMNNTIFVDTNELRNIPYNIKTIEHIEMPGVPNEEIEFLLTMLHNQNYRFDDIVLEYLLDVHLYALADIFVGSHSSIFTLVASLRVVWRPDVPRVWTGYLDSHTQPPKHITLDKSIEFWHQWQIASGGFLGGVPI